MTPSVSGYRIPLTPHFDIGWAKGFDVILKQIP